MDKLVEKIAKLLVQPQWDVWHEHAVPLAKKIHQLYLSGPSIVEIEVDAKLPESPFIHHTHTNKSLPCKACAIEEYQKLLAGWVKKK